MPAPAFRLDSIPGVLASCLDQAQRSQATFRKNTAILHKLLYASASITETTVGSKGKAVLELVGEQEFLEQWETIALNRTLQAKKGLVPGDRVVKFIVAFILHAVKQQAESIEKNGEQDEATSHTADRLASHTLQHLLQAFTAKDKTVRFRATQLIATLINGLEELEYALKQSYKSPVLSLTCCSNDDHESLIEHLIQRVKDKEAYIRVQAVVALGKLQDAEEQLPTIDELDQEDQDTADEARTPLRALIEAMRFDPSADVRRTALFQTSISFSTLPYILSRARDVDVGVRRMLYVSLMTDLPGIESTKEPIVEYLNLEQRTIVIKHGVGDRDDTVKKAAKAYVGTWAGPVDADGYDALVTFTGRFDVIGDTKTAEQALDAVFDIRQDLAGQLQFPDAFWTGLTPETALLARKFIAYCQTVDDQIRLEACLPVITALAFRIEAQHATLLDVAARVSAASAEAEAAGEEGIDADLVQEYEHTAFITQQLLEIALMADYGDEIGRRKMFTLIRDMISSAELPAPLIAPCMDVLLKLSNGERDFQRVVVEIVQNVRESEAGTPAADVDEEEEEEELDLETATAEDFAAAERRKLERSARKVQQGELDLSKKDVYLRCLAIAHPLLERVAGTLQDNTMLKGLIDDLIVPSVRAKDTELRASGLYCLGLCCVLDQNHALSAFGVFVGQSQSEEVADELRIKMYKTIFDILMLHGISFLHVKGPNFSADNVVKFLLDAALNNESPEIAAVSSIGLSKLMLSGMLTNIQGMEEVSDAEVLKRLVLAYFAPETIDNLELRQCLSYFFPVYCYSNSANQRKMKEIFLDCIDILTLVHDELDDPSMMVTPLQLSNQLLDWTDPQKAVSPEGVSVDESIQSDLAIEILKRVYSEKSKDTRKFYCQMLNKLYIPDGLDEWKGRNALLLISQLEMHRPLKDTVSKNALTKFETLLKKRSPDATPMDEEEFRALDAMMGSVAFLDQIKEENENEGSEEEFEQKKPARKKAAPRKRSVSATPSRASKTPSVEPEERPSTTRRSGRQSKPVIKQPVIAEESESEEESSHEESDDPLAGRGDQGAETDDTM